MGRFRDAPAPARRFGQNYLTDPRLAAWLVDAFAPAPGDRVVEIGPGPGTLTALLAARAGRLVAIELDPRMIPGLAALLAPFPGAAVREGDALEVDWAALAAEAGGPLRVIGNLPYNVGTAIVRRVVACDDVLDLQVVLQLEVADRLLAAPGGKEYGPLSVIAALRCRRTRLRTLLPGSFHPRPKVTSCALHLARLPEPPLPAAEIPVLERWLFAGFAHRRKTLAGNLGGHRALVAAFLREAGLPEDARAEVVPPAAWLALARRLEAAEHGARDL